MGHILQLDGLRFIMCCIIFWGHCFSNFLGNYSYGWIKLFFSSIFAVNYFFILSGFGIYIHNHNNILSDEITISSSIKYAKNRIKKIYPVYIFSLLLYAPMYLLTKWYVPFFLLDLTVLQSLAFNISISHGINGVCWFLSALFVSYILCPFFFKIVSGSTETTAIMSSIVVLLIISILDFIQIQYGEVGLTIYKIKFSLGAMGSTAFPACLRVLFGMLLARLWLKYRAINVNYIYNYGVLFLLTVCPFHTYRYDRVSVAFFDRCFIMWKPYFCFVV